MEAFIGSIWFACFTFVGGYVLGNVFGIAELGKVFKK